MVASMTIDIFPTAFLKRSFLKEHAPTFCRSVGKTWSPRCVSNALPRPYQGRALPIELRGHITAIFGEFQEASLDTRRDSAGATALADHLHRRSNHHDPPNIAEKWFRELESNQPPSDSKSDVSTLSTFSEYGVPGENRTRVIVFRRHAPLH